MAEFAVRRRDSGRHGSAGAYVNPGDVVTDFRGDDATFLDVSRGPGPGKDAKVMVRWSGDGPAREYFAGVFRLDVLEIAPCGCPDPAGEGHQTGCSEE